MEMTYNPVYEPLLTDETPVQILFGGSSSGKSYFAAQRIVVDVLVNKRNYLITRNVAKSIRQSTFNEICKAISNCGASKYFTINKTDMVITCRNGYQILSCGLDDPEKIKSITPAKGVITDVLVEEATEIEYNAYKQLDKRLRGISDFKGIKRITMLFNPILKSSWIYQEFFSNWADDKTTYKDDKVFITKTTYKDNKFLTADDITKLESETDPYYYNVYTLGNWGVLGAVIFKNWTVEDCAETRKAADNYRNGLDFGFSTDPAALVRLHYDKKHKKIYILDELYQRGLTNDVLATEVKKIIGYDYVRCDSAEPKSIQELKNYGVAALPAIKGKDSVLFGIQWLQQHQIIIDVSCQNFKNEISQYKWQEDKQGNVLRIPVDKNNHLLDALRYAFSTESKSNMEPITAVI